MEDRHVDPLSVSRRVAAPSLFAIGLLVLVVSGTVGTAAPDQHDRPTAVVAGVLWIMAVVVATRDTLARRVLGVAFAVLVVAVSVGSFVPRFHFVWPARSVELVGVLVLFSAVALGLMAPSLFGTQHEYVQRGSSDPRSVQGAAAGPRRMSVEARTLLWLVTGLVASVFGLNVGQEVGRPVAWAVGAGFLVLGAWVCVTWRRSRRP